MRSIVNFDAYDEAELKPSKLFERYIRLAEKDVRGLLLQGQPLYARPCPGCGGDQAVAIFQRFGLHYLECAGCGTLRVSPSPDDASILRFYLKSASRRFWREKLAGATQTRRREKVIKPRYQWVLDSVQEYLPEARHLVDVHTALDAAVEEIAGLDLFRRKTLLCPLLPLPKGLSGIETLAAGTTDAPAPGSADAVTLFEALDRTADVEALFTRVRDMLRPGGLCFVTAILASGFDIQVLRERAPGLIPPDRLNVFTAEGLIGLFERHGFRILEFSTPGVLDLKIVAQAAKAGVPLPGFVRYLIEHRSEEIKGAFQEFLQSSLLSSYGRALLQKMQ